MRSGIVGALLLGLLCGACGGGGGGGGDAQLALLRGVIVKGLVVSPPQVTVLQLRPNGAIGVQVGSAQAALDGSYGVEFDGYAGPVAIAVTGGLFEDFAGNQDSIPTDEPLMSYAVAAPGTETFANVTVISHVAFCVMQTYASLMETPLGAAVDCARVDAERMFGTSSPFTQDVSDPARQTSLVSDAAAEIGFLTSGLCLFASQISSSFMELVALLGLDAKDRKLDGRLYGAPLKTSAGEVLGDTVWQARMVSAIIDFANSSDNVSGLGPGDLDITGRLAGLPADFPRKPLVNRLRHNHVPGGVATHVDLFGDFDRGSTLFTVGGTSIPPVDVTPIGVDGVRLSLPGSLTAPFAPGSALDIELFDPTTGYPWIAPEVLTLFDASAPAVVDPSGLSHDCVSVAGGERLEIRGENLSVGTTVTIGGSMAQVVHRVPGKRVDVIVPPGSSGSANVVIDNGNGATTLVGAITYKTKDVLLSYTPRDTDSRFVAGVETSFDAIDGFTVRTYSSVLDWDTEFLGTFTLKSRTASEASPVPVDEDVTGDAQRERDGLTQRQLLFNGGGFNLFGIYHDSGLGFRYGSAGRGLSFDLDVVNDLDETDVAGEYHAALWEFDFLGGATNQIYGRAEFGIDGIGSINGLRSVRPHDPTVAYRKEPTSFAWTWNQDFDGSTIFSDPTGEEDFSTFRVRWGPETSAGVLFGRVGDRLLYGVLTPADVALSADDIDGSYRGGRLRLGATSTPSPSLKVSQEFVTQTVETPGDEKAALVRIGEGGRKTPGRDEFRWRVRVEDDLRVGHRGTVLGPDGAPESFFYAHARTFFDVGHGALGVYGGTPDFVSTAGIAPSSYQGWTAGWDMPTMPQSPPSAEERFVTAWGVSDYAIGPVDLAGVQLDGWASRSVTRTEKSVERTAGLSTSASVGATFDPGARFVVGAAYDRYYLVGAEITDPAGLHGSRDIPFLAATGLRDPFGLGLFWSEVGAGPFGLQVFETCPDTSGTTSLSGTFRARGLSFEYDSGLRVQASYDTSFVFQSNGSVSRTGSVHTEDESGSTTSGADAAVGSYILNGGVLDMSFLDGTTWSGFVVPDLDLFLLTDTTNDVRGGVFGGVRQALSTPDPCSVRQIGFDFDFLGTGAPAPASTTILDIVFVDSLGLPIDDVGTNYGYLNTTDLVQVQQRFGVQNRTVGPDGSTSVDGNLGTFDGYTSGSGRWQVLGDDDFISPREYRFTVGFRF